MIRKCMVAYATQQQEMQGCLALCHSATVACVMSFSNRNCYTNKLLFVIARLPVYRNMQQHMWPQQLGGGGGGAQY